MKQSYLFLADGFEEIEALTTVDVMRRAGMPVVTVSITSSAMVTGAHQVAVKADALIADVDLGQAEWLICPGGMPGASNLAACEPLNQALKAQAQAGGKVAAICASPAVVLGPLGLLEGREAVCYPGMEAGMKGARVEYSKPVAIDGNIITGNGPSAANPFALAIVAHSVGEDVARRVAEDMLLYEGHYEFYF